MTVPGAAPVKKKSAMAALIFLFILEIGLVYKCRRGKGNINTAALFVKVTRVTSL